MSSKKLTSYHKRWYIIIRLDKNNVVQFIRFCKKEDLTLREKLLHFYKKYHGAQIAPDSFFLQEDYTKYYENIKYGVFKFNDSGQYWL